MDHIHTEDAALQRVLDAFIASAWRIDDTEITDEPHWFATHTPSAPESTHNVVRRCILTDGECDQRIEQTVARHRRTATSIRWTVSPLCRPADLGDRLVRHGFERGWSSSGMIRSTAPLRPPPPQIEIHSVGPDGAQDFARISGIAWGLEPAMVARIADDTAFQLRRGKMLYYMATIDGEPVGTGHTLLAPGSGYLMGGAVVPPARGRGVYRALVDHRLAALRRLGIDTATVAALRHSSAPICEAMGFRPVCALQDYLWNP